MMSVRGKVVGVCHEMLSMIAGPVITSGNGGAQSYAAEASDLAESVAAFAEQTLSEKPRDPKPNRCGCFLPDLTRLAADSPGDSSRGL